MPTITASVAAFDAKALNCTEFLKSYLADGNRIINHHRKPTKIATIEICDKTLAYVFFIRITSVFAYLCSKNTNTLHLYRICGGIKSSKHNLRTTLQLAYQDCKNLAHTSKTRHVKRTQMAVIVKFTIRVFLTYSH